MDKQIFTKQLIFLGAAEAISNIGNWITMMAVLSLLVFEGEGGVTQTSGIFLAGLVPMLLFSPLAGRLADSFNKVWLMVAGNLLSGLTIASLIFLKRMELVYLCLALEAAFLSIIAPARQGLVPQLVSANNLTRANAFLQQLASLTKIFGPMVGAMIVGLLGPQQAVLLDVLTFVIAAGLMFPLRQYSTLEAKSTSTNEKQSKNVDQVSSQSSVWSVLWHDFSLRLLFTATFLAVLAIMGYDILSSVYTRDVLQADEGFFGIIVSCIGLGSLLSSLYLSLRKTQPHPLQDLAYGSALLSVLVFALVAGTAVSSGTARVIILSSALIGGWGNGLLLIQGNTLLQIAAPPSMLGRLAGWYQVCLVGAQLLSLVITPLLVPNHLSITLYLGCAGIVLVLLTPVILAALRRQPRIEC